ncbi:TIGR04219 family outer membrane beta-barrel protein [Aquifex pyrophilus]
MKKLLIPLSLACFSFSFPVGGEASIGVWNQDPKGYIQYPADEGTTLDLEKDLKLGDKTRPTAKVKVELPFILPNIYLAYTKMKFNGSNNVTKVRFGNYEFNADINTSVKADQYDIGLYYHVPFIKSKVLDPEIGVVVKVVDFKASVSGNATEVRTGNKGSYREEKSETVPIPLIYTHIGVYPFKFVGLVGEFKGIKAGDDYFYEYSAGLRVRFFNIKLAHFFIEGGYRFQRLRLKDVGDVNADIKVGGIYGNIGLGF